MADLDLTQAAQHIVSALIGSGGTLVTSAIRFAKRFSALEKRVEELETELAQTKGSMSWVSPVLDSIKNKLEMAQHTASLAHAGVEALKAKLEDTDRRNRSSRQNVQQLVRDMQSGFKLELMSLKSTLAERLDEEIEKTLKDGAGAPAVEDMRRRVSELERKYDKLLEAQREYLRSERFASFVEEESKRWNDLQRTLGRMEGHFKTSLSSPGMSRVPSPPKGTSGSR